MSRSRSRPLLVVGSFVTLLGVTACTSGSSAGPDVVLDAGPPTDLGEIVDLRQRAEVTIEMADNIYAPRAVEVDPGTVVTFRNEGANVHDATPNAAGAFTVVTVSPTEAATVTVPSEPGTYRFYCSLHASPDSGLQRGAFVVR